MKVNAKGQKTTYELAKNPKDVVLKATEKAILKMEALVDATDLEVSWFGEIEEQEDTAGKSRIFLLKDIHVLEHKITGVTVDTKDGFAKFWTKHKDNIALLNSLLLWGHSHHTMSTGPSGTDYAQIREFATYDLPYMFMLISNKARDYHIEFFDIDNGIIHKDLPITCDELAKNPYAEEMKREFAENTINDEIKSFYSDWRTYQNRYYAKGFTSYARSYHSYQKRLGLWETEDDKVGKKNKAKKKKGQLEKGIITAGEKSAILVKPENFYEILEEIMQITGYDTGFMLEDMKELWDDEVNLTLLDEGLIADDMSVLKLTEEQVKKYGANGIRACGNYLSDQLADVGINGYTVLMSAQDSEFYMRELCDMELVILGKEVPANVRI